MSNLIAEGRKHPMDIELRLAALERANKRYRLFFGILVCAICATALMGFGRNQVPDKIQAKKFEVVNDEGKVLARMDIFDGVGSVTTYTKSGEILTDIVPTKSGAGGVVVYDGNGKQNVVVTDVSGGGGSIRVNNSSGSAAVTIGRNGQQAGSVSIQNRNEKKILLLTGDTADAGAILAYDNNDKQIARLPGLVP